MNIKLIDLNKQYEDIKEELNSEVINVLSGTNYIIGPNVKEFEKEFANYIDIKHAISVGNGTDALVIALKSLNIGKGDEVITTPFTFFATVESIMQVGATPVLVDVRLDTYNMDENLIEEKITNKTKAILPVHIFGQSCNMDKINEIAKKHNLYVIEDACQAIGARFKEDMIGTLSDIACFSFFPTKNLGCAGDGGMIVTNNDDLATLCRGHRAHGSGENGQKAYNIINNIHEKVAEDKSTDNTVYNPLKYYNYFAGFNSRLDEIQAAILRVKLRKLEEYTEKRIKIAEYYNENLKELGLVLPVVDKNARHVCHLYLIQSENKDEIMKKLKENGIATGAYYPIPMHMQKALEIYGYKKGDMPNAEYLATRTFAIPMFPELSEEEKKYIVDILKKECMDG